MEEHSCLINKKLPSMQSGATVLAPPFAPNQKEKLPTSEPPPLELHVLSSNLPRPLLRLLIPLHRRQTKRRNQKLPSTQRERQVLSDTIASPRAALSPLRNQRQLVHFHHSLGLLLLRGSRGRRRSGVMARVRSIHQVRERRQLQHAVGERLSCAGESRGARMQGQGEGGYCC